KTPLTSIVTIRSVALRRPSTTRAAMWVSTHEIPAVATTNVGIENPVTARIPPSAVATPANTATGTHRGSLRLRNGVLCNDDTAACGVWQGGDVWCSGAIRVGEGFTVHLRWSVPAG